ncbi:MAG: ABC transporter ATP-binding protein [Thermoanaerobaculia bacterium]
MSIVLEDLTKRYGGHPVVNSVSLEIADGELFVLLGSSGSGKSTLLRMIAGLSEVDAGRVLLHGRDVTDLPPAKRGVGFVFQSYALFRGMSVAENVEFALAVRGVDKGQRRRRRDELLELVGLSGLGGRTPRQLSGGQQQRVALARALVCSPRVLLLDEPLGALDLKLRKQMQLFLKRIQHDIGITFIHVTHDQEEAMTMADGIAVMNKGRIEQLGSPDELYERPQTPFVAGFLGVSNLLPGTVAGPDLVRLDDGTQVYVRPETLHGRTGRVAVGIRPEKIRIDAGEANSLDGIVKESAYVGVATQYIAETESGRLTVYVQNVRPGAEGAAPGDRLTLSWSPDATFVVDSTEGSA